MKMSTLLSTFLFVISGMLAPVIGYASELRELTSLEKETFALLKKKFPDEILDNNLKTLHELAESPEYKNFLTKAYPNVVLPPEFTEILNAEGPLVDDILYKILPPKERYFSYYTEHFGIEKVDEVTNIEHFIVHHEVTNNWIYDAIKRGGDTPQNLRSKGPRLSSRATPKLRHSPQFKEMVKRRHFGIGIQVMRNFDFPILRMSGPLLADDTRWIQTLFEKHGNADGILRMALQDPTLLSRIRYAFTTDTTFLRFVHTDPNAAEAAEREEYEKRSRARQQRRKQTQP